MDLNNRAFQQQSTKKAPKKLDVVLRQLTGDALTEQQRRQLRCALGCRRQYRLRLCASKYAFSRAMDPARAKTVRILLNNAGSQNDAPMAVLVRGQSKRENTVYIYLPKLKEALRDETRTKEAKEA